MPFVRLMDHFWLTRDWPLVLLADAAGEDTRGYDWTHAPAGGDKGWCQNLLDYTEHWPDVSILLMQEDFFIDGPVDHAFLVSIFDKMQADPNIGCFRVLPCPGSDAVIPGENWGWIEPGTRYRVSCQAAFWRPSYLRAILRDVIAMTPGTPADFEIAGTEACVKYPDKIASVNVGVRPLPYIVSAISRGKWNPGAVRLCERLSIPIDTSRRAIE